MTLQVTQQPMQNIHSYHIIFFTRNGTQLNWVISSPDFLSGIPAAWAWPAS